MVLKIVQFVLSCGLILGTFSFAVAVYEYEKEVTNGFTCDFVMPCDEVLTSEGKEMMLATGAGAVNAEMKDELR